MVRKKRSPLEQTRIAAESSLLQFIKLVAPHRVLGAAHEDVIKWWTREDAKNHQLLIFPRDHQKSALVAYRAAWMITKNPAITILYISSTSNLAEKQLKFIKDILDSKIYRRYWPDMLHPEEGKRKKWSTQEIEVDHPLRKAEGVRDPTVFTAGLTTSITGLHCNICILDDVVVQENAYTKEGRTKVEDQYSLLASIESTDAMEWVVGTRYHEDDLYGSLIEMEMIEYDEVGNIKNKSPIYEVYQREVEDRGDGTGEYLWPRQPRGDGKWFGFDQGILAVKKAQYLNQSQFHAQYYNNPNDTGDEQIDSDYFQYYDRKFLERTSGIWEMKGRPLNVFASIDFAFSLETTADWTALVVIGIDPEGNIYVLDIDRFKTKKISVYFEHIEQQYIKWGFRKLRAEVTVAQEVIVEDLRDKIRQSGLAFAIDKFRPVRSMGTKEERIHAVLSPRYENYSIWHYRGGYCTELETELRQSKPRNDDIKDALANAVQIAIPPKDRTSRKHSKIVTHSRFGGVAA